VYCSAFVSRDGESVADSLPAEFVEFLAHAAPAPDDREIKLPSFARLRVPTVYTSCRDNRTMPPGSFTPGNQAGSSDPR
jgi:hypothetical protein